jgi:hypothetical protein
MGILGGPLVGAQVRLSGGLQALVAQDLVDVADRAAVEQESGGDGVAQEKAPERT